MAHHLIALDDEELLALAKFINRNAEDASPAVLRAGITIAFLVDSDIVTDLRAELEWNKQDQSS